MNILVIGATGATGRLLVAGLLERGHQVKVIVRSAERMLGFVEAHPYLRVVEASFLDLSDEEVQEHVKGYDAVASCLGHNPTLKGIFGGPRRLVTDSVKRLCKAISVLQQPTKLVLMNTTGVVNPEQDPRRSLGERMVLWLLRYLLPPQADNEQAAAFLQRGIGKRDELIEWSVVRPDTLIDREKSDEYKVVPSPIESPIFGSLQTSRSNVAELMAELLVNADVWDKWKNDMPIVYNRDCLEA
jgi:putative NADH-flavin reductase